MADIVESSAFTATIRSPDNGTPATGPGIATAFIQGLTNRTRYLYNALFTSGVTLIRSGSITAMQAVTGAPVGTVFLATSGESAGLFVRSGLNLASAPYAYLAADGGSWVHEVYALLNQPIGIPVLDENTRIRASMQRKYALGPNADATLALADQTIVKVPTLTANRKWALSTSGASEGDRFEISAVLSSTGAYTVEVHNATSTGTTLASIDNNAATGTLQAAVFYYIGGAWQLWHWTPKT